MLLLEFLHPDYKNSHMKLQLCLTKNEHLLISYHICHMDLALNEPQKENFLTVLTIKGESLEYQELLDH